MWDKIAMRESGMQQVNSALNTKSHRIRMIIWGFLQWKIVESIPQNSADFFLQSSVF